MNIKEFEGINSFLVGMAKELLDNGVKRETRGHVCYELPYPLVVKVNNPLARIVTLPERYWNHTLPYIESLWLSSGRNDIMMPGFYLPRLREFSDDSITMRAGYGPRFRGYDGTVIDYEVGYQKIRGRADYVPSGVDQFSYVYEILKRDPSSRQAVITLADPVKDCFENTGELKTTKDQPCTRSLQFMINQGKLDLYVHMRSNDFVWGASGVNIFNFTFIQEVFAHMLGLEIGSYYHIANNFHYYHRHQRMVETLAAVKSFSDEYFEYERPFLDLKDFDSKLLLLNDYEHEIRTDRNKLLPAFGNDFLDDWGKMIFNFHFPNDSLSFKNTVLDKTVNKIKDCQLEGL